MLVEADIIRSRARRRAAGGMRAPEGGQERKAGAAWAGAGAAPENPVMLDVAFEFDALVRDQRMLGAPLALDLPARDQRDRISPHPDTAAICDRFLDTLLPWAESGGASHVHVARAAGARGGIALRLGTQLDDIFRIEPDGAAALIAAVEGRSVRTEASGMGWSGRMPHPASDGREIAVTMLRTRQGERLVLRLPARQRDPAALVALGMPQRIIAGLDALLARPGGLIVVAGPAGGGASTTLATMASRLDDGRSAVLALGGAGDFAGEGARADVAAALRLAAHQDVDVIAIDRLDCAETAEQALRAAQAGHLVLAGMEAPDAVSAVGVLRRLRVDRYRLAANLRAVVAQQLVRRLCPACRTSAQTSKSVSALLGFEPGSLVHTAQGCAACDDTGFRGKSGVFEALLVDEDMRRLIYDGADASMLARYAFLNAPSIGAAARALVREGATTAEEAMRVARASQPAIVG